MYFLEKSVIFATKRTVYEIEDGDFSKRIVRFEVADGDTNRIELFTANRVFTYFIIFHVLDKNVTKQLLIFDGLWTRIRAVDLKRAANCIRFIADDKFIFSDKNGEVFEYDIPASNLKQLLGHCSLITDVGFSPCGKFVLSGDRDEKIRVSNYPSTYDIECYCLGHRKFVSKLAFVGKRLISGSGDGTIRFWDYSSGKCLKTNTITIDTLSSPSLVSITDFEISSEGFILIELFDNNNQQKHLKMYKINDLELKFVQNFDVSNVLYFTFDSQNSFLIILTETNWIFYQFCEDKSQFVQSRSVACCEPFQEIINDRYKFPLEVLSKKDFDENTFDNCKDENTKKARVC